MDDEELTEIEELSRRGKPHSPCKVTNIIVLKLIAEVRRLKGENEKMKTTLEQVW